MSMEEELPFTQAELDELKGAYSTFWDSEDHSAHALFQDTLPEDLSSDPTLVALQSISEDTLQTAEAVLAHWHQVGNALYKDALEFEKQGNLVLKRKRVADALSAYARALQAHCEEAPARSAIHANRAICLFKQSNFARSVDEAKFAILKNPQNVKGYFHAARACLAMSLHKRALSFVDEAYRQLSAGECSCLESLREQLREAVATRERNFEKAAADKQESQQMLERVFAARHIDWRPTSPFGAPLGSPYITEANLVAWPVLFLVDEHGVSEGIDAVEESVTIQEMLDGFFSQRFGWDKDWKYRPDSVRLQVWKGSGDEEFAEVADHTQCLLNVLPLCKTIHAFLVFKVSAAV